MEALFNINLWVIVKIMTLFLLGIYIIFALVVVRQIKLMTDTLELGFESQVKAIGFFHLVFAIIVFISAVVIL